MNIFRHFDEDALQQLDWSPDCKRLHWPSERLAFLSIRGTHIRAVLKSLGAVMFEGF